MTNTTDVWSAAATVFVVVALAALTAIMSWEHSSQRLDHERLEQMINQNTETIRRQAEENVDVLICTAKLHVYVQTLPKGQSLTWQNIPAEYWRCLPRNLLEDKKK